MRKNTDHTPIIFTDTVIPYIYAVFTNAYKENFHRTQRRSPACRNSIRKRNAEWFFHKRLAELHLSPKTQILHILHFCATSKLLSLTHSLGNHLLLPNIIPYHNTSL